MGGLTVQIKESWLLRIHLTPQREGRQRRGQGQNHAVSSLSFMSIFIWVQTAQLGPCGQSWRISEYQVGGWGKHLRAHYYVGIGEDIGVPDQLGICVKGVPEWEIVLLFFTIDLSQKNKITYSLSSKIGRHHHMKETWPVYAVITVIVGICCINVFSGLNASWVTTKRKSEKNECLTK